MKTVNDIRTEFLSFFEKNGHTKVASSNLVPENDPTLMFANSGMVQFKNVFTGIETRDYTRATTAQKCVRAGGKHNDLDNVGYTARHHTFFEMLGNFSFGDYFKEEAITYAWEFLTKVAQINPDKLYITVHSTDEEAAGIWKKIANVSDNKIIRISTDDNFWRMGDTGPCGPSSEIFYDHGEKYWGGPPGTPEEDGDRFIEIWNLVFMQFEEHADGSQTKLPKQCIDTGMSIERLAAIMQGVNSNYEIDLMDDLIQHVADLTHVDKSGEQFASHRVIADHLRCASFLLADGVMPSNEGRGYVLRRIMRRGMRHAHLLGASEPLMYKLLPTLVSSMGEAYPELKRAEKLISETLKNEETRFKITLDRGLKLLDEEIETKRNIKNDLLDGKVAFTLYDTYGFPVDLTQDALRSHGLKVDMPEFEFYMDDQKMRSRESWSGSGDGKIEKVWHEIFEEHGETKFLGYEKVESEAKILAIVDRRNKKCKSINDGERGFVILNQTPFYGESGGQVGDTGTIVSSSGYLFRVEDTKKLFGNLVLHYGQARDDQSSLKVGDFVTASIDHDRRTAIRSNHSVTHLLHEALRRHLGDHVAQKGSLQDAERTRFDISQPTAITAEQLQKVEAEVNEEIKADSEVVTRIMPLDEARESGARALFGEKYDEEVRVVSMGTLNGNQAYSVELCGGTHVKRTGEIGKFKIISEGAVSSGIRRVEAITGERVDQYETQKNQAEKEQLEKLNADYKNLLNELKSLGGKAEEVKLSNAEAITKENKKLQKQISDLRLKKATESVAANEDDIKDFGGIKFIGKVLENFPAKDLKPMADDFKKKIGSGVVALIATDEGKASIVVAVTSDLTDRINAVDLVKLGAEALGGKGGGGRPDMAQAGGSNPEAANDAVRKISDSFAS